MSKSIVIQALTDRITALEADNRRLVGALADVTRELHQERTKPPPSPPAGPDHSHNIARLQAREMELTRYVNEIAQECRRHHADPEMPARGV